MALMAGEPAGGDESPPLSDMIVTVSHELRQPLASIRGFTEMLLAHWADFPDADKVEMLKEVHHDAVRVGKLIDELVAAGRAGDRDQHVKPAYTDLGKLVNRVVNKLKLSYPELVARVQLPSPARRVLADGFKIEQVLTNLIENACKHGAPGTVRVRASYGNGQNADVVEVAVSDQGPGISEDELPHVTERGFRGGHGRSEGLGLGLWISKEIVEAHGGRLLAQSRCGEGTTVCFTIPGQAGRPGGDETKVRPGAASGKLAGS